MLNGRFDIVLEPRVQEVRHQVAVLIEQRFNDLAPDRLPDIFGE